MKRRGNRNVAPKIISILFALVLWIYVMGTNPSIYRNIANMPVKLMNVEELKEQGLAIKGSDDFRVKIRLKGRRDAVYEVSSDQIQIKADLRGYGSGINNIPLEVTVLNNIEMDVSPRFISVELEGIVSKQKEIKVITSGILKDNFVAGNLEYKPTTVWIEGAESYVNLVENVIADLDVTGRSKNVVLRLPLKPVNRKGEEVENVDVKAPHVDVSLSVDLLKSVPIKPDLQITTEAGYTVINVEVNPTDVVLRGQEELINEITEIITELIKIENLNHNKTLNVKLNLPKGVTLHEDIPIIIDLHLEKVEEATYKISKDKIIFSNVDEKLKVDTSDIPESINLRMVALKSVLDSIKESDIKIVVDLNELDANKYTIELVDQLPFIIGKDIKELYLNPETIDVKLIDK